MVFSYRLQAPRLDLGYRHTLWLDVQLCLAHPGLEREDENADLLALKAWNSCFFGGSQSTESPFDNLRHSASIGLGYPSAHAYECIHVSCILLLHRFKIVSVVAALATQGAVVLAAQRVFANINDYNSATCYR
jgi:hypothetical protein